VALNQLKLSKWLSSFAQFSFGILCFTLPLNLNVLVASHSWDGAWFNPYLNVFLTHSDLLVICSFLFFLGSRFLKGANFSWGNSRVNVLLAILLFFILLSDFLNPAGDFVFGLVLFGKIFVLFAFYFLLVNEILPTKKTLQLLVCAMSTPALLAIFQFVFRRDFGLQFFGESILSLSAPNIARIEFFGEKFIRAYGTFPHPNVLAAALVFSILAILFSKGSFKKWHLFLQIPALVLTFSRTAILSLLFASLLAFYARFTRAQKIAVLFCLLFAVFIFFGRGFPGLDSSSVQDRLQGYYWAVQSIFLHPFGTGWNQSTLFLDEVAGRVLQAWEYQPAHNLFLLLAVELGLIGFLALLVQSVRVLAQVQKKDWREFGAFFLVFLMLGSTDHFFWSLDQGRWIFILLVAFLSLRLSPKSQRGVSS
jgi:hypothetical protein